MNSFSRYNTMVFDCDGVILDSNSVKTEAFRDVAMTYGKAMADAFVAFHCANGGISRYKKFDYFLRDIIGREPLPGELGELLENYAGLVRSGLLSCEVSSGLRELRKTFPSSRWLVVSGGDQTELRNLFVERDLSSFFDGGIFGSPDSKDTILSRELGISNIKHPAVFIGDSRYDYEAATKAGLDFVFVSKWSEFAGWEDFFKSHPIVSCKATLADLMRPDC